ncbi:hypothetical protein B0H11DRAFT_1935507 [Mycena galericulata]|nr:hypothetical protein B0H11DRAFT_1935507 [Mycena galericulata]
MSTSTRKDRCIGFSIHRAPANVSRKDFEAKAAVLVESLVALPVTQRNCVKFDLNDALDGFLEAQGLLDAKQKTSVWIMLMCECESADHFTEVYNFPYFFTPPTHDACCQMLQDPEAANLIFSSHKESGYAATSSASSVDVTTKLDIPAPVENRARAIGVFNAPPHMSTKQFHKEIESLTDSLLGLPFVMPAMIEKTLLWCTMNWDHIIDFAQEPAVKKLVMGDDELAACVDVQSCIFSAYTVATKVKRF